MTDVFSRLGSRVVRDLSPARIADPFAAEPEPVAAAPIGESTIAHRQDGIPAITESESHKPRSPESQSEPVNEPGQATPVTPAPNDQGSPAEVATSTEPLRSMETSPPLAETVASPRELVPSAPTPNRESPATTAVWPLTESVSDDPAGSDVGQPPIVAASLRAPDPIFTSVAAAPSADAEASSRPTVQVHIGRLDVRANLEKQVGAKPAARPARRASAGSVSLGDYLAGRKVGS